jgi:predicted DCC family thiol-disulfide oxidoreductase YuxK
MHASAAAIARRTGKREMAATNREAPLVALYDGACGFCTRQATLAQRIAGRDALRLQSTSEPGVLERYGLAHDEVVQRLYVQDRAGHRWGGAAAVARLLREVPVIGLLGWVYYVPGIRQAADAAYRWISAHRYQISRWLGWETCADGACALPGR